MSFKQRENAEDWLSLADLSMGGFIIFLVLTIVFISRVPKSDKVDSDVILKSIANEIKPFEKKYNIEVDTIKGTIRFKSDEDLFMRGKSDLSGFFKNNLEEFLELYFSKIDSHKDRIVEIRIEGHTDTIGDYMTNLKLSQDRAYNVLQYIRQTELYNDKYKKLANVLDKCIITSGYSYAKALDINSQFISESKRECDTTKSRRVEFLILLK